MDEVVGHVFAEVGLVVSLIQFDFIHFDNDIVECVPLVTQRPVNGGDFRFLKGAVVDHELVNERGFDTTAD